MVPGDGVGTVEAVDDPAGTERVIALGVEKVLERIAGEVAPVGFTQDHSLNQDLGRDLGIKSELRLFQERQAHQITHPFVIFIPCQLDITPAVVDLVRPRVRLAILSETIVEKRYFSEVNTLRIRENYSLDVSKTIFEKLGYPSNKGGLEKDFIKFLDLDGEVESFIKINETQHMFSSIFYIRQDGLLSKYSPDFLVKTKDKYHIVETKGEDRVDNANVKQKQLATLEWCKKINTLNPEFRDNREWEYVLISDNDFYSWSKNGANFQDICKYCKVVQNTIQGTLF